MAGVPQGARSVRDPELVKLSPADLEDMLFFSLQPQPEGDVLDPAPVQVNSALADDSLGFPAGGIKERNFLSSRPLSSFLRSREGLFLLKI
jgi:hypothetical protein